MGFFGNDLSKKKDKISITHFKLKYKFDVMHGGSNRFFLVDDNDDMYELWVYRDIRNIYVYKVSDIGDEMQLTQLKDHEGYDRQELVNLTKNPSLKRNIVDYNNGVKK